MNKLLSYLIALCVIVCGIGGLAPTASAQVTEKGPEVKDLMKLIKTKKGKEITLDEFKAVFLNYAKVAIDPKELKMEHWNNVTDVLSTIRSEYDIPDVHDFCIELLSNDAPQLRLMAIDELCRRRISSPNETTNKIMDALEKEKDPAVIRQGLSSLSNVSQKDERMIKFMTAQADNKNAVVRNAAAELICDRGNKGIKEVIEAAHKLTNDPDEEVRRTALRFSGRLNDESFIDDCVKVLNDPELYNLHFYAMKGLYGLWFDYPKHEYTSQKAYEASVNYLTKKPRTSDVPEWMAVNELGSQKMEPNLGKWKEKATYYSDSAWITIMADIASDKNANWMARRSAIQVIGAIGTKEDVEKLKTTITSIADDDSKDKAIEEIDKQLEKLNK